MNANFVIVPITEAYINGYRSALDSVARERKYLAFLEAPSLEMTRAFVLENILERWPHFVAIVDGIVVGWCDISSEHRPVLAHCGSLGIGIVNGHRGKGIGEALMSAALQKAKDKGLTRIGLTVRENNSNAVALYKKLGFVIEGLHRNAIRVDKQYENQMSMGLLF